MKGKIQRWGQELLAFPILISTPTPCAGGKAVVGKGALHNFYISNPSDLK